jgi:hypothetical protein
VSSFQLQGVKKGSKCLQPAVLDIEYWTSAAGMPSPYGINCTSLSDVKFLNYFRRCGVVTIFVIAVLQPSECIALSDTALSLDDSTASLLDDYVKLEV